MDADRWSRIEAVFNEAADLAPEARAAFLDDACRRPDGAPDAALREEVEAMLGDETRASAFFASAAGHVAAAAGASRPPEHAGPWTPVRLVGRGGMGEVYLAERRGGGFEQRAALKLIQPGLAPELVARFRAERAILAGLEHPGIARLLDGGVASDGRPYLATEFVDGVPLTDYADDRRLSVNERLALFAEVCEAVAYAHRNLVVHRDLKPSNILVTDEGRVKLLDFGIARLLDAEPDDALTRTGQRAMTPAYAAPEQVRGDRPTTATDAYALGVLLYELLTGRRPYRLDSRARHAVEQAILEAPPTRPSTAVEGDTVLAPAGRETVGGETATSETLAAARASEPGLLRRRLAGDLDAVVLKALRKEPERRYGSAAELADDVRRHLAGEPVTARPDTVGYRLRTFVRRNTLAVGAAAAVALALVAGTGVALWQAAEARAAQAEAEAQAETADEVTYFLTDLFAAGSPLSSGVDTVSVRQALALGAERIGELDGQPLVQARLLGALGMVYIQLGGLGRADSLLTRELALARANGYRGEESEALDLLAAIRYYEGDYAAADSLARLSLAIGLELDGPDAFDNGVTYNNVGLYAGLIGAYDEAERFQTEALRIKRLHLDPDDPDIAVTVDNLAFAKELLGKHGEAEALRQEALAMFLAAHGETHPSTGRALLNVARAQARRGDLDGARATYQRSLGIHREVFGDDHPETASAQAKLGQVLAWQGRDDQAEPLYRAALATAIAQSGDVSSTTAHVRSLLGALAMRRGDLDTAGRLLARAQADVLATLPEGHIRTTGPMMRRAELALLQGRPDDAEALARQALDVRRGDATAEDYSAGEALAVLADALAAQGQADAARRALEQAEQELDADILYHRAALDRLARVERRLG